MYVVLVSSNSYSVSEYFSSRLATELVNHGTVERREFEAIYRLLAGVLKLDKYTIFPVVSNVQKLNEEMISKVLWTAQFDKPFAIVYICGISLMGVGGGNRPSARMNLLIHCKYQNYTSSQ